MSIRMLGLALGALVLPAVAQAKTSYIGASYARQLVVGQVKAKTGHSYPYRATLLGKPSSKTPFLAKVNWGKRPHIMIALPSYTGTVNMLATKAAPKGQARVKLTPGFQPFGTP